MTRIALFAILTAGSAALAQPPIRVVSPEVDAERRVTFRLRAPQATKVELRLEGVQKNAPMEKGENGIWSVTVGPLEPNYYGYGFIVDTVPTLDPSNAQIIPNLLYESNIFLVPGTGMPWEVADVPHGQLHRHFYKSGVVGDQRDFFVYTPPSYDPKAKKHYPVLYLLHGYSDDASGWTAVGKAHVILDNLIAQGKAKPMLIVMTLGYGAPEILKPNANFNDVSKRNYERYRESLLTEVIPYVEKNYLAASDRTQRAIAGLSMGGAESLFVGLSNLDKFAYVGAFSAAPPTQDYKNLFSSLDDKANAKLKVFWIACGREDFLYKSNLAFNEWLTSKGVKYTWKETAGAHTWMNWRNYLTEFAPLLF